MDILSFFATQVHTGLSRCIRNPQKLRYAEVQLFNLSTIALLAPALFRLFTLAVPTHRDLAICISGYIGRQVFKTALFNHAEDLSAQGYQAAEGLATTAQEILGEFGINGTGLLGAASQMGRACFGVNTPSARGIQQEAQRHAMRTFNPSKNYQRIDLNGYHLFWVRKGAPTQNPSSASLRPRH